MSQEGEKKSNCGLLNKRIMFLPKKSRVGDHIYWCRHRQSIGGHPRPILYN